MAEPLTRARRARTWGLRARIGGALAAAILVAGSGAGALVMRAEVGAAHAEARQRAAALLETLAVPCAMAQATRDVEALDGYLEELTGPGGEGLGVGWVAMLDHTGAMSAQSSTGTRVVEAGISDWLARADATDNAIWRLAEHEERTWLYVSMPAVAGLRWGTLVGRFDLTPVDRRIRSTWSSLLTLGGLLTLVVLLIVFLTVDRAILRSVRRLGAAAERIMSGDLSARARVGRGDELDQLASTFNAMASELESYTGELEERVAERTAEAHRKHSELEQVNTRLEAAVHELARLARTDELTDLLNRRAFRERMAQETRRSGRTGYPLALLALDIDYFKQINDGWGHPTGDRVLQQVSRLLRYHLRGTDVVGRDRVRTHPFVDADDQPIDRTITTSVGVALLPEHGGDVDALLRRADEALYAAKDAGRDRVELAQVAEAGDDEPPPSP